MSVKNLFKIEELLECMADNYCHVNQFIGATDVDVLLGGIKEGDNLLKKWNGSAIIIWFNDKVERENLWTLIYKAVKCEGDENIKTWFYTSKKDEYIMIIPFKF